MLSIILVCRTCPTLFLSGSRLSCVDLTRGTFGGIGFRRDLCLVRWFIRVGELGLVNGLCDVLLLMRRWLSG